MAKRALVASLLVIGVHLSGWAQPIVQVGSAAPDNGDNFCIPVSVVDFTDITEITFSIQYDPSIISYTGFANINATMAAAGFSGANIVVDQPNGTISVTGWSTGPCNNPAIPSVTLGAGEEAVKLFDLCFDAIGSYGQQTTLQITDSPTPIIVYRQNVINCFNIGLRDVATSGGTVTIGVRPFTVNISNESGSTGDQVCVDFLITQGWDNLASVQFSLNYDPAFLQYQSLIHNNQIPNLAGAGQSFGVPGVGMVPDGVITCSWAAPVNQPSISVPDSTLMFQVCFTIIGDCASTTLLEFSENPRPIEVTNEIVDGFPIPFNGNTGVVTSDACDPTGIQLNINCGQPVNLNDQICVQVAVGDNFTNVRNLQYLMQWNPNILEFASVGAFALTGLNAGRFDVSNTDDGVLGLTWSFTGPGGATRPSGAVIYEVCFNVIGLGGDSPVNIIRPGGVGIINPNNDIGINPGNCVVEVIQPTGVGMSFPDTSAPPGEQACVPVTVVNFENIISYQFTLNWDPAIWTYQSIQNINLSGATQANFNTGLVDGGGLIFEWTSGSPVTVPDTEAIFEVCFTPATTATPGQCDQLDALGFPTINQAISSTSNGDNIGIITTPGELCVLFPDGFGLTAVDTEGDWLDTVCMPFTVESFDNINTADFTISWDPSTLNFVSVTGSAMLPSLNFDETSVGVGALSATINSATPIAVPDDTEALRICFELLGDPEACYPVEIENAVVTTANGPGSVVITNGELCVNDRIIIDTIIITPESCPGKGDAKVDLVVRGGQQPYGTTWELLSTGDSRFQPLALSNNISAGQVAFTVYDFSGPSLSFTDTITIPLLSEAPVALAGEDRFLPCDPPLVSVGCEDENTNLVYTWQRIDAPNQPVLMGCSVFFSEPGTYQLTAQDPNGCLGFDTLRVLPSTPITADAMAVDFTEFSCTTDSITLTIGNNTPVGSTIRYAWTTIVGGPVNEATADGFDFVVYGPGRYELTVVDLATGCEDSAEVIIDDARIPVDADAGVEQEQNCDGTAVLLDGGNTSNPSLTVTYEWLDPNGVAISDSLRAEAVELGVYTLIVTDAASGCTGMSTVAVVPNSSAPTTNAGEDQTITCTTAEVTLSGVVNPVGGTYQFQWTPLDGGALTPGTENSLQAEATAPGLYELRVTDTGNNCTSTDTVLVIENRTLPLANAGEDRMSTCEVPNVTLNGTASSQGDTISYQWFLTDLNNPIAGAIRDSLVTDDAGTYILQVSNSLNGCTATDTVAVTTDAEVLNIVLNVLEGQLNCLNDTITIEATLEPANIPFTAAWTVTGGGSIIGATDGLVIQTDQPGTYEITVTRTDNGCVNEQQAIISSEGLELPAVLLAEDTVSITCLTTTALLDGSGSEAGQGITYTWTNILNGEAPSPNNGNTVSVVTPGTYELLVRNSTTGCESRDTVVVLDRDNPPLIEVPQEVGPVTCANQQTGGVSVTVLVSNFNNNISVAWTGLDGGMASPPDQRMTNFTEPGRYGLLVRNNLTGCETRDTVNVTGDLTPPTIQLEETPDFTCTSTTVAINATATGAANLFSNINWTSLTPGNTVTPATGNLTVNVNGAGDYLLSVTLAGNGCSADSVITVAPDQDAPIADAGEAPELECGETSTLDGSGSTQGPNILYDWTTLSGEPLTGDLASLMPMVSGAGSYQLIVTNNDNGCRDTATVNAIIVLPPDAAAGEDQTICETDASLSANLPAGTTGVWSTTAGATFTDAAAAQTNLTGLAGGAATVVWTLSAPGCPDYSSDSLTITRAATPIANQDFIEITADGPRSVTLDVTANDLLNGADNLIITLVSGSGFGLLDTSELASSGTITFLAPPGIGGSSEAVYQICNADCPNLCATARVLIEAEPGEIDTNTPNTITPNGDGLNETLIFDVILYNPADKFPNNELTIFNRWGDIVFEQAPYGNNWGGEGKDGKLLPEGTYYYVLRLDISEGIILRGDITIVR